MKKEKVENYYKNTCCDSCHHNSTSLVGTQERQVVMRYERICNFCQKSCKRGFSIFTRKIVHEDFQFSPKILHEKVCNFYHKNYLLSNSSSIMDARGLKCQSNNGMLLFKFMLLFVGVFILEEIISCVILYISQASLLNLSYYSLSHPFHK